MNDEDKKEIQDFIDALQDALSYNIIIDDSGGYLEVDWVETIECLMEYGYRKVDNDLYSCKLS